MLVFEITKESIKILVHCAVDQLPKKLPNPIRSGSLFYSPIHDVAPNAVRIAEAIDAIN